MKRKGVYKALVPSCFSLSFSSLSSSGLCFLPSCNHLLLSVPPMEYVSRLGEAGKGWLFLGVTWHTWKGLAERATLELGILGLFPAPGLDLWPWTCYLTSLSHRWEWRKGILMSLPPGILFWPHSPSRFFHSILAHTCPSTCPHLLRWTIIPVSYIQWRECRGFILI